METNELKLRLQQHFGDGLVVVVGSGLSCAEGLPGMPAIATHLQSTLGPTLSDDDKKNWDDICVRLSDGLEAALLKVAPRPLVESAIAASIVDLVVPLERKIVEEVFSGKRTLAFSRLVKHLLKPSAGIPVVTTNYDRLIEIAVEEAGLGVDTMFVGNFAGEFNEKESRLSFCRDVTLKARQVQRKFRDRVNLFKPHGSLDWYFRYGKPVRCSADLSIPRLIITPGLNKFRNGYESPFDRHRDRANAAVDRASRFLVVGYGFNDDHLETHLAPKIRSGTPTLRWFGRGASKSQKDQALSRLHTYHKKLRHHFVYISASPDLWYLKRNVANAKCLHRYSLTLQMAAMHRLSELSRYDPKGLMNYLNGRENWLLTEFIELSPPQFIDELVCEMTSLEFALPGVRPRST